MKTVIVVLVASFALGFCTPYVTALISGDGDPSCTGCTTNHHPTTVKCNGGDCNGSQTQLDETSCNKCCTDAKPSACSGKDGVVSVEAPPPEVRM